MGPIFNRDLRVPKKKHSLYYRWLSLHYRINNKNYHKGIKMCHEWENSYMNFLLWSVKNGYRKGLILSRKDKNEGFSPDNCIWGKHTHSTESLKHN